MDPNDWTLTGNPNTDPNTNFLGTTDSEPLVIRTNGVEALRITQDGNVGVGTTTPRAKLDLPDRSVLAIGGVAVGGWIRFNNDANNQIAYAGREFGIYTNQDNGIRFYTGGSNFRAIINNDGNVGIGTASPICKLTISGAETTPSGGGSAIQLTNSASGGTNWYLRVGATGTDTPAGGFSIANVEKYCLTIARNGDVTVDGDVILTGADCAEEFDIAEAAEIEPGMVVVLDQDGVLHQSHQAYDKRVAGVISGAGDYKSGLILDRRQSQDNRVPVALVGKVYCKVDAQYAPIEAGDLLTTSPTLGHAMKADDPFKAFGSVIGKALRSLETGQGLIPILIALQ